MSKIYFNQIFDVAKEDLNRYGAFNISLITDLPLFIDPFLLFNSENEEYQKLHNSIIEYLKFLKRKSAISGRMAKGCLQQWYIFSEVKQNWLGYSFGGNAGKGLSTDFAKSLNENLNRIFSNFSEETITTGSHLEKLCLIKEGVGKDSISDFVTNLIKDYLLKYTENFAKEHIDPSLRRNIPVDKSVFNYETETWATKTYDLPYYNNDFVILTPKDLLTKEDTWINRGDLVEDFDQLPFAVPNIVLRAQINNYFNRQLSSDNPTKEERAEAIEKTLTEYPQLLDYFIKSKEVNGDSAVALSEEYVQESENYYIDGVTKLRDKLKDETKFYISEETDSYREALKRMGYLKDVIENKDGYRYFYSEKGQPIHKESDLQIAYLFVWYGTNYDVNREVNNGRGPADFKASMGSYDNTIIEMKLASNKKLKQNLQKQAEIYARANNTKKIIKAILYFTQEELDNTMSILNEIGLAGKENVILIDARDDNKISASRA